MNPELDLLQAQTRRHFLRRAGQFSLGSIAMNALLGSNASALTAEVNPLAPHKPHFPAKVKRVVYLHMSGGPPHLDIFDHKPELVKRDGQDAPDAFIKGKKFAFTTGVPKLMGSPHTFTQHGKEIGRAHV